MEGKVTKKFIDDLKDWFTPDHNLLIVIFVLVFFFLKGGIPELGNIQAAILAILIILSLRYVIEKM